MESLKLYSKNEAIGILDCISNNGYTDNYKFTTNKEVRADILQLPDDLSNVKKGNKYIEEIYIGIDFQLKKYYFFTKVISLKEKRFEKISKILK